MLILHFCTNELQIQQSWSIVFYIESTTAGHSQRYLTLLQFLSFLHGERYLITTIWSHDQNLLSIEILRFLITRAWSKLWSPMEVNILKWKLNKEWIRIKRLASIAAQIGMALKNTVRTTLFHSDALIVKQMLQTLFHNGRFPLGKHVYWFFNKNSLTCYSDWRSRQLIAGLVRCWLQMVFWMSLGEEKQKFLLIYILICNFYCYI